MRKCRLRTKREPLEMAGVAITWSSTALTATSSNTGPGSLFQAGAAPATCDWNLASTASRTGILVALCDGSVRLLAAAIAPALWWSALQPNDGGNLGDW